MRPDRLDNSTITDADVLEAFAGNDRAIVAEEFFHILGTMAEAGLISRNADDDGWELTPVGRAALGSKRASVH